jgi:F0F1-type ATP synthase assembly protein I
MMAERGWDFLRRTADMGPLQIVGILAIIGLVAVLVVMRRKDGATTKTKTTKSTSTRI